MRRAWLLLLLAGCGEVGGFTGTRSLNACGANYPVCNTSAGCVLDESQYVEGVLPGQRAVIFRTQGPALVRVRLLLTQEIAPGSLTQIEFNQVGCGSQQLYSTMGQNLFNLVGAGQQLAVERPLQGAGDHLIRLQSDATARYQLRVEVAQ